MSFRDTMPPLEHVQPVHVQEVYVTLVCKSCCTRYSIELHDLLDIAIDGRVTCECSTEIEIPWGIRMGALI